MADRPAPDGGAGTIAMSEPTLAMLQRADTTKVRQPPASNCTSRHCLIDPSAQIVEEDPRWPGPIRDDGARRTLWCTSKPSTQVRPPLTEGPSAVSGPY